MPWISDAQRRWGHTASGIKALGGKKNVAEWDSATKGRKLPARVKAKKKPKFVVNNKMKSYGRMDLKTNVIEVNRKKHKGNKAELADTIKHELMHVKHPKMHEKTVYKKTPAMTPSEQEKMIAKLRMKKLNYKAGAIKRKLNIHAGEKVGAGDLIKKAQTQKARRVAIMGM